MSSSDSELVDEAWRRSGPFHIDDVVGTGFILNFRKTGTAWRLGRLQTEKIRTHEHDLGDIDDATGVCIATQIQGPSPGMKAVAKIKMQLTDWDEDVSQFDYIPYSMEVEREIENLERLTELGCSCTPKLIDYEILYQGKNGYVSDGYIVFILMEKVPGRNLDNFHTFPLEKRDQVRIAFGRAIREFHLLWFTHWDSCRRNLIWDEESQRCFIVDLEDASYCPPERRFGGRIRGFCPLGDLMAWDLNSRVSRARDDDDPMMPDPGDFSYYDDEEALEAFAIRAKERAKEREQEKARRS